MENGKEWCFVQKYPARLWHDGCQLAGRCDECRWRQSIHVLPSTSTVLTCGWRPDHHHLWRPLELRSIAANELAKAPPSSWEGQFNLVCLFTEALHLPDSPWTYLTLGTSQNLVESTQTPTLSSLNGCPAWQLRQLESCRGSRVVLDDYTTMLTRSLFISSTWRSSHSIFIAILTHTLRLDREN